MYKVGQRVEILSVLAPLKHRFAKGPVYGRIIANGIDGEYHLVRPMWCKWETEVYRNEIKAVDKPKKVQAGFDKDAMRDRDLDFKGNWPPGPSSHDYYWDDGHKVFHK